MPRRLEFLTLGLILCLQLHTNVECINDLLKQELSRWEQYMGLAYVITTKSLISLELRSELDMIGYQAILLPAVQPFGSIYDNNRTTFAKCMVANGDDAFTAINMYTNMERNLPLSLAEIGLICSHRNALDKIATDTNTNDTDWSFVMEDDARLHPSLLNTNQAKTLMSKAFSDNACKQSGFVYLGICGAECLKSLGGYATGCRGYCTHAYAVTKLRAKTLYSDMYHTTTGSINCGQTKFGQNLKLQIDQAYRSLFDLNVQSACLTGNELHSPDDNTHVGIFYQPRAIRPSSGSNLVTVNNFKDLQSYSIEFTGKWGQFMFAYAFLTSFCSRFLVPIAQCGYVYIRDPRKVASFNQFQRFFGLTIRYELLTLTNTTMNIYIEHPETPHANILFDEKVFRQPNGTYFIGSFSSLKYFHRASRESVRTLYSFPKQLIQQFSIPFFKQSFPEIPTTSNVVCMHVHLPSTSKDSYDSWAIGQSYYIEAIQLILQTTPQLTIIPFIEEGTLHTNSVGTNKNLIFDEIEKAFASNSQVNFIHLPEMNGMDHRKVLLTMSLCEQMIISVNKNSWWSAYLAKYATVYAPGFIYFNEKFDRDDYYPMNWNIIYPK